MTTDIDIVGIGCRLPGARGPDQLWDRLSRGDDLVGPVPADRYDADAIFDPTLASAGAIASKWGGFLDEVDRFDRAFFAISRREATTMDPQQRLLLEVAWEALEDAGIPPSTLAGRSVGVYVGISLLEYWRLQITGGVPIDAYTATGNGLCVAANRISYCLDLKGPSVAVDTACSASLVAVHLARRALVTGECELAIAAGANVILTPDATVCLSRAGVLSPTGRCRTFSADADGYVRAEGIAAVVLRRGDDPAPGQRVYARVAGSALGSNGLSNGLIAPNGPAQLQVARSAWADAGIDPATAGCFEAHGTGTVLGDAVELRALSQLVGPAEGRTRFVGSIKSNVGHLESTAGVGGLVKLALGLFHGAVPPSLHCAVPNATLDDDRSGLRVPDRLEPWPAGADRVGGVSSFGFGGANAHAVLRGGVDGTAAPAGEVPDGPLVVALGARSEGALDALRAAVADRLDGADGAVEGGFDLTWTLAAGRDHHALRWMAAGPPSVLAARLREPRTGPVAPARRRPRVLFVFPGQGPRPVALPPGGPRLGPFDDALARADDVLGPIDGRRLLDHLRAPDERSSSVVVQHVATVAVQLAAAHQWRAFGVEPAAVVGHSLGEVAAAAAAGALTDEQALAVALARGRAVSGAAGTGGLAVLAMGADAAVRWAAAHGLEVGVAAANGPDDTVVVGTAEQLDALVQRASAEAVFCRRLEGVDFAAHSPAMAGAAGQLEDAVGAVEPAPPAIALWSTVTGERVDRADRLDAAYWASNLVRPVRFAAGFAAAAGSADVVVEVSRHPLLGLSMRSLVPEDVAVLRTLHHDEPPVDAFLAAAAGAFEVGVDLDWAAVLGGRGRIVSGPTYPWQGERVWLDATPDAGRPPTGWLRSPTDPSEHAVEWDVSADEPWVGAHRIDGEPVLPGSAYLWWAAERLAELLEVPVQLDGVRFRVAMALGGGRRRVRLTARVGGGTGAEGRFEVHSRPADDPSGRTWVHHASGGFVTAATQVPA